MLAQFLDLVFDLFLPLLDFYSVFNVLDVVEYLLLNILARVFLRNDHGILIWNLRVVHLLRRADRLPRVERLTRSPAIGLRPVHVYYCNN